MSNIQIKKATRAQAHLLIAMTGTSGSGKTFSAINLARGLVGPEGKIGFIDTETGRASLYADVAGGFDVAELNAPFKPSRYLEYIRAFEDARYDVLIIDSGSHEWEGKGGVVDMAGDNPSWAQWKAPKLAHKHFMQALLQTRMHVIVCLRAKERLKQVENPRTGKKEIVSEGLFPIQDKGFVYEMTISGLMRDGGHIDLTKCPAFLRPAFKDGEKIGIATGERLVALLGATAPVDHDLEAVKRAATDAAYAGYDALKAFFTSLSKEQQRTLKPYLDSDLKPIAVEADEAKKAEQQAKAETEALDDPFGAAAD